MRLTSLTVENFRAYREPTTLSVPDFTAIIGRNDVGKSTLLDALEIFFNGAKLDADDAHIDARGQPTRISCRFDELPAEVVIDARAPTTLADENLLNPAGELEIVKQYDLTAKRIVPSVFAKATHPTADGGDDLLQLNNTRLKARVRDLGTDMQDVDQRVNGRIRRAIWDGLGDLEMEERLVALNAEDGKKVWTLLQKKMPTFALFQADRRSRDDDSEVTDPFDTAIKDAVKGLETQFDQIKEEVKKNVQEVAARTLEKLREMDPSLADELRTVFRAEPRWAGFKLSLTDDRDIPINKRGSGVRRLILLNFFRAEAEKRQETAKTSGIIYAIEEPESSQHPSNQRLLINALLNLSAAERTQVLITTHVPGIAGLLPQESIRYIEHDNDRHPRVIAEEQDMLTLVAEQLGVLPDQRVQLLLYVEGPNDVAFLEHASQLVGSVDLINEPRIAFVLAGGGNLKHWVNRHYLRDLGRTEIHIYDRDDQNGYQAYVDDVNARDTDDWATLTTKREIENYLHPDAVREALSITITIDDETDVPQIAARAVHDASGSDNTWEALTQVKRDQKTSRAKRRLCNDAMARMSTARLRERDPNGEVEGWFRRISDMLE